MDKLLRAREVAAATGIPRTTVYKLAQSGELPCVHYGTKAVRFPESAVQRWIERQTAGGDAGASDASTE